MKKTPTFDYKLCACCGICAQHCPVSTLSMTNVGKQGKYTHAFPAMDAEKCIGCGICESSCPMDAIFMEEHP